MMASQSAACSRCRAPLYLEAQAMRCFGCARDEHFPKPTLTTIEAIEQFLKANRG